MSLIDAQRDARVAALVRALTDAVPDSSCIRIGSLGRGDADVYSDIDLQWDVGRNGAAASDHVHAILGGVAPVESLRWDQTGDDDRLAFVRFVGWPLFSRLDLHILGDFRTAADVTDSWSPTESALMNVVGALKAHLRGRPDVDGLLVRGFQRVNADDPGGDPADRMKTLVSAVVDQDRTLRPLADLITRGIRDHIRG